MTNPELQELQRRMNKAEAALQRTLQALDIESSSQGTIEKLQVLLKGYQEITSRLGQDPTIREEIGQLKLLRKKLVDLKRDVEAKVREMSEERKREAALAWENEVASRRCLREARLVNFDNALKALSEKATAMEKKDEKAHSQLLILLDGLRMERGIFLDRSSNEGDDDLACDFQNFQQKCKNFIDQAKKGPLKVHRNALSRIYDLLLEGLNLLTNKLVGQGLFARSSTQSIKVVSGVEKSLQGYIEDGEAVDTPVVPSPGSPTKNAG